jgi:arginyl-tRNA synthetase
MIKDLIADEIQSAVSSLFGEHIKTDDIVVEKPASKENGNFSSNVSYDLAKKLKKNPAEIATNLSDQLNKLSTFKEVKSAGGFVNFYLNPESYQNALAEILAEGSNYGKSDLFKGQKVQIEFISANPTGPLTIAIGRGGFGGDVLANLFSHAGADVTREYYVNDGGNQVRILGESILIAAGVKEPEGDYYRGEYLEAWAKDHSKEIAANKDDVFALGSLCVPYIMKEYIEPGVKKMKIIFDTWFSEKSIYDSGLIEKTLKHLDKEKLTYDKDGAKWLKTTNFGDDKDRVIVKSNGDYTYVMPDIAYHWNKFAERKFDKVINILGADHHGYTERMLAGVGSLGYADRLTYLLTQMVKLIKGGKEYRMSKRKGVVVTIDDILELIGGPEAEASDVARFFFLSRSFNTPMNFDLDLAAERTEKNPVFYVKYAFARINGILTKIHNSKDLKQKADLTLIQEPEELDLIDQLWQLPALIESTLTMGDYPMHQLTFYSTDLAKKFHQFYDKCRVIDEENLPLTAARLELVRATAIVLGIVGQDLLGIDMPEKM